MSSMTAFIVHRRCPLQMRSPLPDDRRGARQSSNRGMPPSLSYAISSGAQSAESRTQISLPHRSLGLTVGNCAKLCPWLFRSSPNRWDDHVDHQLLCRSEGATSESVCRIPGGDASRAVGAYPRPADWLKGTGIGFRLKKVFPALQTAVATLRPYVTDKAACGVVSLSNNEQA